MLRSWLTGLQLSVAKGSPKKHTVASHKRIASQRAAGRRIVNKKVLDGQEAWLRERLRRHRGNADVSRQELAAEKYPPI